MNLPDFIQQVREIYAQGEISLQGLTDAVGGETKHMRTLSQIIRGESFEEAGGPLIRPDFHSITPYVEFIREDYRTGRSLPWLAENYRLPPLVVRRIVAGLHYRYVPGYTDKRLREYPLVDEISQKLGELATQVGDEWLKVLYPQRFIERPDPVWLQEDTNGSS